MPSVRSSSSTAPRAPPAGIGYLVELAELLQAPVIDQRGRMNMPNTHYLNQTGRGPALIGNADVIIGLELSDYWATVNAFVDNGHDGIGLNEVQDQAGHQADRHQLDAARHQVELPGFPALPVARRRHGRRRRGDACRR